MDTLAVSVLLAVPVAVFRHVKSLDGERAVWFFIGRMETLVRFCKCQFP